MATRIEVDAAVIGAGHHGLVAAAILADAGWDVLVLEAQDDVGGAVRSTQLCPGFVADRFSSFHPLAVASPVLRALELEHHGLRWAHAPAVLAHPLERAVAVLHRDPGQTAAGLAAGHPRDGDAWLALVRRWERIEEPLLQTLFAAFPPVRGPVGLLRRVGTPDALRIARFAALPATRMARELFDGEPARMLLLGNAAHGDAPPVAPVSGALGWLLAMLGQRHGFPAPVGGAGSLAAALLRRAEAAGAQVRTGERVERVVVHGGRAVGLRTATGLAVRARRVVVADVSAPALFGRLLAPDAVPARLREDLRRFEWDTPTVKIDWALDGPVPWRAPGVAGAGTVHLGAGEHGLVRWSADLETGRLPRVPFVVLGQMTTTDPGRSPAGTECAWAYSHLPPGRTGAAETAELARRVVAAVEAHAPGFGDLIRHQAVRGPAELEAADANLVGGAVNGGTAQLHQQLLFRPVPGLGRAETPVAHLFLASASAHPGGGVHGACGHLAARAALAEHGGLGPARRALRSAAMRHLFREAP
ncbi:MAG: phytoene desaturase family protein [Pseudonocardia sp.]